LYRYEQNKAYLDNYLVMTYEKPNAYLYKFNGKAELPDST